jgi:hypothetical protein
MGTGRGLRLRKQAGTQVPMPQTHMCGIDDNHLSKNVARFAAVHEGSIAFAACASYTTV